MNVTGRAKLLFAGGLVAILLVLVACGSSAEPTPTPAPTPTSTPVPPPTSTPVPPPVEVSSALGQIELTETVVFKGFGFSIDYLAGWTVETQRDDTVISEPSSEGKPSATSEGPPPGPPGYSVSLRRAPLAFFRTAGLPENASLEDLLSFNSRSIGWQVLESSETTVFGVLALSVTTRSPGLAQIAVMGFREDEAFLLTLLAPSEEARDEFIPVWARMLDSIRPVTEAPLTAEERYFEEVDDALVLTGAKLGKFGSIFGQAFETRQRLINALLEAGVGTAFTATLEALQQIEVPAQYKAEHQRLVENQGELVRLDGQAAQAVRDGDLARFVLVNGQLGEVSAAFITSLSAEFCNALHGGPSETALCAFLQPPPGGTYGTELNETLRTFQPQFLGANGALGFPLSLDPEENAAVIYEIAPAVAAGLNDVQARVSSLNPPEELAADHDRLVQYFERLAQIFGEVKAAVDAGDMETARMSLPGIPRLACDTRQSFSSPDFKTLVKVHFGIEGCGGRF